MRMSCLARLSFLRLPTLVDLGFGGFLSFSDCWFVFGSLSPLQSFLAREGTHAIVSRALIARCVFWPSLTLVNLASLRRSFTFSLLKRGSAAEESRSSTEVRRLFTFRPRPTSFLGRSLIFPYVDLFLFPANSSSHLAKMQSFALVALLCSLLPIATAIQTISVLGSKLFAGGQQFFIKGE